MTSSLSVGIRRSAFEKLAALAVKSPNNDDSSDLARLARQTRLARQPDGALNGALKEQQAPTSRIPMVRLYLRPSLRGDDVYTNMQIYT